MILGLKLEALMLSLKSLDGDVEGVDPATGVTLPGVAPPLLTPCLTAVVAFVLFGLKGGISVMAYLSAIFTGFEPVEGAAEAEELGGIAFAAGDLTAFAA